MTSLTHRCYVWQRVFPCFVLALLVLVGCKPAESPKKEDNPSTSKVEQGAKSATEPTEEIPSAEGPVKEMKPHASQKEVPSAALAEPADNTKSEPASSSKSDAPTQPPPPEPQSETTSKEKPTAVMPSVEATIETSSPVVEKLVGAKPVSMETAKGTSEADLSVVPTTTWMPKPDDNPSAEAAGSDAMKPYTEKITGTDVTFDMVPIPGGVYKMGSPASEKNRKDDEGPQSEVKIAPFWMGKCEVTWKEYELWCLKLDRKRREAIDKASRSEWDKTADALANPTAPYLDMSFGMGKDGYPAICMTQFSAKMYCKWLSAKTGHYYRLPTEAEWEYACRAGTTTSYSFGDDPKKMREFGWFGESEDGSESGNSNEKYHKVGTKKPNPWGLFDMHGNVAEWCLDQFVPEVYETRQGKLLENPLVPSTKPYPHVVRGGSWIDPATDCRSASRRGSTKDWKMQDPQIPQSIWYHTDANFVGFRVVRPLQTPTPEEAARYEFDDVEKEQFRRYREAQAGKQ